MKTNASGPPAWRAPLAALALLALTTGVAHAADPASMAHYFSSHPMISGTVVAVNDHQMVVNTDQGEQVTLEMDTRTMAPRDLRPGMVMRADFKALEDCRLYARSIEPVRGGTTTERMQVYANTQDSPDVIARNATAPGASSGNRQPLVAGTRMTTPQTLGEHSPGRTMTAMPTSADYVYSTRPMVSGRVVTVNDHRLVVRSDQGQTVGMVMDSETRLPRDVGPGTFVRAEFTRLKDGRYLVKEASLIGSRVAEREQAYAHTVDSDNVIAQNVPECEAVYPGSDNAVTMAEPPMRQRSMAEPVAAQVDPEPYTEETLPQTASRQPQALLLGLLALAAAGAVQVFRGIRAA